jgi:putative transposase
MNTYTQILYQIVFGPWKNEHTLSDNNCKELYNYIFGVLRNKNCHLYRIGGTSDHIHILTHLHPSIALAQLVKDIKIASSEFIKSKKLFPYFSKWQDGYAAFTYCNKEKGRLIQYIKNQEEHHKVISYHEELKQLLKKQGIEFEEKYLL